MEDFPALLSIEPVIQHYDWGGQHFIPRLTGREVRDHRPCAEWWIGAHAKAPSRIFLHGRHLALDEAITTFPEYLLGQKLINTYQNSLPFLLKVLDVASMLSIQAHPHKWQAEQGFARENAAGIPLDAANRVFKDDNHKPELMVALSDFYLLSGFRTPAQWKDIRAEVPELQGLPLYADPAGLKKLFEQVMTWSAEQLRSWAQPLVSRLEKQEIEDKLHPDYWAKKAWQLYGPDRGLVSIYLLQVRHLAPGEGYFQGPGILHAYLEGQNVEIMANSDNVFRGGLTTKHVDVDLLLAHTHCDYGEQGLVKPVTLVSGLLEYPTPSKEFRLLKVPADHKFYQWSHAGPTILLPLTGESAVRLGEFMQPLNPGQVKYVVPGAHVEIRSDGELYFACV